METITLSDAMRLAEMGSPFSMVVCSFDDRRETGGKRIQFDNCVLVSRKKKGATSNNSTSIKKARHKLNDTRNVELEDGSIRSFHPRLIEKFNGKEVVY